MHLEKFNEFPIQLYIYKLYIIHAYISNRIYFKYSLNMYLYMYNICTYIISNMRIPWITFYFFETMSHCIALASSEPVL